MGRFPQDGNFACYVSLLKSFARLLWPYLICWATFSVLSIISVLVAHFYIHFKYLESVPKMISIQKKIFQINFFARK